MKGKDDEDEKQSKRKNIYIFSIGEQSSGGEGEGLNRWNARSARRHGPLLLLFF